MAIVIDGMFETLLREKMAKWREADERYNLAIRSPGLKSADLDAAIRAADVQSRMIVLLLSTVVDP